MLLQSSLNRLRSFWSSYRSILLLFLGTRFIVFLINAAVFISSNLNPTPTGSFLDRGIALADVPLLMWQRWDANHYINIASNGYTVTLGRALNTAYFPLYPLLGFLVSFITSDTTVALLLVSNMAFLSALIMLYKLARLDYDHNTAMRAVTYVSLFPFTIFFAGVFTESLFLLLLVSAFYYARTQAWFRSSVMGLFTTATRLVGMALTPALMWEYLQQRNWDVRELDRSFLALFLIPVGLLAFMVYTHVVHGDFFSTFNSTKTVWGGEPSWPWVSFFNQFNRLGMPQLVPIAGFELAFGFLAILGVAGCFFSLRTSYAVLATAVILIAFSNVSLQSFCRYVTTVFPMYILLAHFGRRNVVHVWVLMISTIGMIYFTALFGTGKFIG